MTTYDELKARTSSGPLKPSLATDEVYEGVHCCRLFELSDAEIAPFNAYGSNSHTAKANADLLAHRYNHFDDLLAALEAVTELAYELAMKSPTLTPRVDAVIPSARAAIAKAKEIK